jgi:hypothetical protein
MDEIFMERAEEREREAREQAIARSTRAMAPQYHPDFDGVTCVRCGDDMPPLRLSMGKVRCTACQTLLERNRAYQS